MKKAIDRLIEIANKSCDAMEGADADELEYHEQWMTEAMSLLKMLGVEYDPITRMRVDL